MSTTRPPNLFASFRALLYKSLMLLLTLMMSADLSLRVIGLINRWVFGGRFKTATLFYLADTRYLDSVTFPWYARSRKWAPVLGGVFSYAGTGGFICVMGCNETDFCDPANADKVLRVYTRMEHIAALLQAETASYSGILPSVLARLGVQREPIEAIRTVEWVLKAIKQVRHTTRLPHNAPLAILGSDGHIGKRLVARLIPAPGMPVLELDTHKTDPETIAQTLKGNPPLIFINAARGNALDQYLEQIPPGSVVLNEVYPECGPATLAALTAKRIRYFHICGVQASSLPGFPRAYAGAVPCCAASAVTTSSREAVTPATVVLRESQAPH